MPSISVSEISTYSTCPQKHHLMYTERLARNYQETGPLRLGTIYHEIMAHVLQASYNRETPDELFDPAYTERLINWTAKTWSEANRPVKNFEYEGEVTPDEEFYERWQDTVDTGVILARLTVEQLDVWNRFEVLDTDELLPEFRPPGPAQPFVEYKVSFPLMGTDYVFNGIIDAVVRDRNTGHIVVLDWKTKGSFINENNEMMNMQVGLYQYVLQQMGLNVQRGLIYQIKSTVKKPGLNQPDKKTGIAEMSRRMITTTWGMYRDALLEAGLDPLDYQDMKAKLQAKENEIFMPIDVFRSQTFLTNLWRNVYAHVIQIRDDENRAMALGFACYQCPFNELCRSRLEGWPIEDLIEHNFIRLPPREIVAQVIAEEIEDV